MTLLGRWGHRVARRPKTIVAIGAAATVGLYLLATVGVGGEGLFQRVETGPPLAKGSDSWVVFEARADAAPTDEGPSFASYVQGFQLPDDGAAAAFTTAAEEISQLDHVRAVLTPFTVVPGVASTAPTSQPSGASVPRLVNDDGDGFLIWVTFEPFGDDEPRVTHERIGDIVDQAVQDAIGTRSVEAKALHYSNPLLFHDFTKQIEQDLITGELIALPAALLVMVFVFGGFLAAATPLTGAVASISGGLAVLYGFSHLLKLDQSAVNVVTVLGIGLSIDYGLLIVSRFREELHKRDSHDPAQRADALSAALATAGRTVVFSGVIVAIAVGGMVVFTPEMMRGFGGAGLGVVSTAVVAALTIVPAVAFLWAKRIAGVSVIARVPGLRHIIAATSSVDREEGAFSRLAAWGQRRPWLVAGAATALLLVLASPVLHLTLRNSDVELLPVENERRQYLDAVLTDFPELKDADVRVYAEASTEELDAWLAEAANVEGVVSIEPAYDQQGFTFAGIMLDTDDAGGPDAVAAVERLRELDAPFRVYLGGAAATQIDFVDAIVAGAPLAAGLVVLATFVMLFLMTGSLLVPLKTLIINSLSLLATLGFVTWVFQDGNLEAALGFDSTGGIETYIAVLIVAFGFGLAMDYEVFLLARVKEYVDAGVPNDEAVRRGLQRSGRIITSAAAVIVLVFMGFAFGKLLMIKEVGVGLAFAVLLDATVVRLFLVPATMTLLGDWNWWAPAPLRRLYARAGVRHD